MDPFAFIEDYLSDQENGMKNLITWFLNQAMLQEALQQAGADSYERTDARKAHRNGYKDRSLKTRYGETILRKLQFPELPFETQVFGRYARVEKTLVNAVVESYLQGVSTRKIQEIIAHLGIDHLSPASVSRSIQKAASAAFLGASWQMCSVHCTQAVLRNIPRKHQKEVAEGLKEAYGIEQRLQDLADDMNARGYRKAANTIERFLPGLMSYMAFPKQHWKRIRTTNMMERVYKELKRRTKVVGAFPNEEALLRLVGSILMDINEEWVTGRRYLTMEKE